MTVFKSNTVCILGKYKLYFYGIQTVYNSKTGKHTIIPKNVTVVSRMKGYCSRSTYSEGETPKCLRKMVEKWARLEKPTV